MASGVIIQPYYPRCLNLLKYLSYKCIMTVTVHTHSQNRPLPFCYIHACPWRCCAWLCMVFTTLSLMAVKKFASRLS